MTCLLAVLAIIVYLFVGSVGYHLMTKMWPSPQSRTPEGYAMRLTSAIFWPIMYPLLLLVAAYLSLYDVLVRK